MPVIKISGITAQILVLYMNSELKAYVTREPTDYSRLFGPLIYTNGSVMAGISWVQIARCPSDAEPRRETRDDGQTGLRLTPYLT